MLLQRRYEFILSPKYFITVVTIIVLIPSCFFTFLHPQFFLIFSLLVSFVFLYGIYNFISDSMFYLYLQCTLHYSLDSTIAGSKITLIMCSIDYVM